MDINAILDRLPTAATMKQDDGSYPASYEVYGNKGIETLVKRS